jgi:16S rRNA (adenine1518-N6/adenine1519-N6)-dimethyltransferase
MTTSLYANKLLGQHFLRNEGVIERIAGIVESAAKKTRGRVLEIGPGPGALTRALLARKLKVLVLEIDNRMIEHLQNEFREEVSTGYLKILSGDALKLDLSVLGSESIHVCGNLPYNVGTHIVFRLLEEVPQAQSFCFMLQKEVVERFLSEGNEADYGIPSVKLAWSCQIQGHFWVKPGSFSPPPKVDSGVFWFDRKTGDALMANPCQRDGRYDLASKFVSGAFQHRRKMLRAIYPALKETTWGSRRAQELSPAEFIEVAEKLSKAE